MAEAAGLAVGITGLAVSFKACIDLFDCFYTAKKLDHDFYILVTKLDIERTKLLQWGERTGILRPDVTRGAAGIEKLSAALPILKGIKALLCDGQILQTRYAIKALKEDQQSYYERFSTVLSKNRLEKLTAAFDNLSIGPEMMREAQLTDDVDHKMRMPFSRFRWAIHDKAKFSTLITDLSYFVSSLRTLFPVPSSDTSHMHAQDLAKMKSADKVRCVQEAADQQDLELIASANHRLDQLAHSRLLECLWFRWITDRRNSLSPPNPETFEWALSEDALPSGWSSLPSWLKSSSGIYWVSGKAASGKSTLMKFISQHERTRELNENWADNSTLTMAGFYFYHLGTSEQKSQQGLLRSLLHDILKPNPDLSSILVPEMWRNARALKDDETLALPSAAEMKYAFHILTESQLKQWKFCFFIDGLDEFSGNLSDGIEIISSLGRSANIKVIVSSRPLQACVRAFSSVPQLRLEDLTRGDMMRYINQKLDRHSYVGSLNCEDPRFFSRLCEKLVRKASGVFLWVVLVCRTLLEGFDNYDRPAELEQRIADLPDELGKLFEHMLEKISRSYQIYAFKILQICRANHDLQDNEMDVLSFTLADQHELEISRLGEIHPRDGKSDLERCLAFEGRIRSRCRGLVETIIIEQTSCKHDQSHFDTLFQICQACDRDGMCTHDLHHANYAAEGCDTCKEQRLKSKHVEFIHRSLLEYMDSDEFDRFSSHMKFNEFSFDPYVALSCVIFHSSVTKLSSKPDPILNAYLLQCLGKVQSASIGSMKYLCIELGRFNYDLVGLVGHSIYDDCPESNHASLRGLTSETVALLLAAEFQSVDLFDAVWKELGKPELSSTYQGSLPLYHAKSQPFLKSCKLEQAINPDIIRHLQLAGCDLSKAGVLAKSRASQTGVRARNPYKLERVLDSGTDRTQLELYHDPGAPRPDVGETPPLFSHNLCSPETFPTMDLSQFFLDTGSPETPLSMETSRAELYHNSAAPLAMDLAQPYRCPVAPLSYARSSISVHAGVKNCGIDRSPLLNELGPESTPDATDLWIRPANPAHARDQLEASTSRQSVRHSATSRTSPMPSLQLSDTNVDASRSQSRFAPVPTLNHGSQHPTKKRHAHDRDGGSERPPEKYPRINKNL